MGHDAHLDRPFGIVLFIACGLLFVFVLQDLSTKCIESLQNPRQSSLILQPIHVVKYQI